MRSPVWLRSLGALLAIGATALGGTGCATSPKTRGAAPGTAVIEVAASINAWGSILSQLGGSRVKASSIISNPETDPHAYEPTPADGRTIALSRVFVENGVGYDPWAQQSIAASPDPTRTVIDVGRLVAVAAGGNPHRWYSPTDVDRVSDAITASLKHADPADAGYFDGRLRSFRTDALSQYHQLIREIRAEYAGTPVGASESIFAPLADALGLKLITPAGLLKAVSEGTDPAASDKAAVDAQIASGAIKVYVFNSQNSTPDVTAQRQAAEKAGIPIATVTETLTPAGASFQQWQSAQLRSLQAALRQASAR